jgi:hypothetical protein
MVLCPLTCVQSALQQLLVQLATEHRMRRALGFRWVPWEGVLLPLGQYWSYTVAKTTLESEQIVLCWVAILGRVPDTVGDTIVFHSNKGRVPDKSQTSFP